MATTDRLLKLLSAQTDEELEKEIEKLKDNQKNLLIKSFIKIIKEQSPAFDISANMGLED